MERRAATTTAKNAAESRPEGSVMPTHEEQDQTVPGDRPPNAARRRRVVAGTAGAALVLGGTSYLVTGALLDRQEVTREPAAIAPITVSTQLTSLSASAAASSPTASPATPSEPASTTSAATGTAAPTTTTAAVRRREEGAKVQRESDQEGAVTMAVLPEEPVTTATEILSDGATVHIMSAREDLTDKGQHAWAADRGDAVGDARCTDRFKFNNTDAEVKKTMVMCWRNSARRSVVAVAFAQTDSRPSAAETAKVVARYWAKLG
jgi:hypothetical protein